MTTTQPAALPELPEPFASQQGKYGYRLSNEDYYTADQMRAYALAALQPQPAEVSDVIAMVRERYRGTKWGKAAECICDAVDEAILALRPAQQAVPMTPRMVELLAEVVPVENHDNNGPGSVTCPACDAYMHMRWKAGQRIDKIEDLAHDADCPAVWARGITKGEA